MPQSARTSQQDSRVSESTQSRIRVATMADYKSIIDLYYKFDQYHYSLRPGYYKKPTKPGRSHLFLVNALVNPLERLFLYEQQGEVLGLMHLRINPAYQMEAIASERTLSMLEIAVFEPEHNPEVSYALQQAMVEFGQQNGCARVIGDVDNDNIRSRKFLEKNGGYPVSIRYHKDLEVQEGVSHRDLTFASLVLRKWTAIKVYLVSLFWRP